MFWPGCIGMAVIRTALALQRIGYSSAHLILSFCVLAAKIANQRHPSILTPFVLCHPGETAVSDMLCCFSRKAVQLGAIMFRPPQRARVSPVSYCDLDRLTSAKTARLHCTLTPGRTGIGVSHNVVHRKLSAPRRK